MKAPIILLFCLLSFALKAQKNIPNFDAALEELGLKGSIVIYDIKSDIYYTNNSLYNDIKFLPASTFKIVNAMVALELGIVKDSDRIFKWNGESYPIKAWEKDMNFKEAFQASCVPCFKEIAREIGAKRMSEYLKKAQYPTVKITKENIDNFWLEGNGFVSINQQIEFLKNFYEMRLPFKISTYRIMHDIMQQTVENDAYILKAKTGLVNENLGWFVGILESDKPYIFAINLQTKSPEFANALLEKRKLLALLAFKQLGIIK